DLRPGHDGVANRMAAGGRPDGVVAGHARACTDRGPAWLCARIAHRAAVRRPGVALGGRATGRVQRCVDVAGSASGRDATDTLELVDRRGLAAALDRLRLEPGLGRTGTGGPRPSAF